MTDVERDAGAGAGDGTGGVSRNTPARTSGWAAAAGAGLIVGIGAAPVFWLMYGALYTAVLFACGVVAIVAGHLGRRRGRRLGGRDRGLALLGVVAGWGLVGVALLLVLAYAGVLAGLAVLGGIASGS